MNFYNLEKDKINKYDAIIFSSSFMLMPDTKKALEIALNLLNENGKIYFLMTLYKQKGTIENLIGYIKPYLKYITTIDFGEATYEKEFLDLMEQNGVGISYMRRLTNSSNIFLSTFRFFVIEANKI